MLSAFHASFLYCTLCVTWVLLQNPMDPSGCPSVVLQFFIVLFVIGSSWHACDVNELQCSLLHWAWHSWNCLLLIHFDSLSLSLPLSLSLSLSSRIHAPILHVPVRHGHCGRRGIPSLERRRHRPLPRKRKGPLPGWSWCLRMRVCDGACVRTGTLIDAPSFLSANDILWIELNIKSRWLLFNFGCRISAIDSPGSSFFSASVCQRSCSRGSYFCMSFHFWQRNWEQIVSKLCLSSVKECETCRVRVEPSRGVIHRCWCGEGEVNCRHTLR